MVRFSIIIPVKSINDYVRETVPHIQRPAAFPPSDGYPPPEDPLVGVARQIHAARECKRAVPSMPMVGSN